MKRRHEIYHVATPCCSVQDLFRNTRILQFPARKLVSAISTAGEARLQYQAIAPSSRREGFCSPGR